MARNFPPWETLTNNKKTSIIKHCLGKYRRRFIFRLIYGQHFRIEVHHPTSLLESDKTEPETPFLFSTRQKKDDIYVVEQIKQTKRSRSRLRIHLFQFVSNGLNYDFVKLQFSSTKWFVSLRYSIRIDCLGPHELFHALKLSQSINYDGDDEYEFGAFVHTLVTFYGS